MALPSSILIPTTLLLLAFSVVYRASAARPSFNQAFSPTVGWPSLTKPVPHNVEERKDLAIGRAPVLRRPPGAGLAWAPRTWGQWGVIGKRDLKETGAVDMDISAAPDTGNVDDLCKVLQMVAHSSAVHRTSEDFAKLCPEQKTDGDIFI